MNAPPNDEGRPRQEAPSNVVNLDIASMPERAACCGELGLEDIAECARRGLYCSPESCAYRALLRRQLERRADEHFRIAELTVAADYYGGHGHYFSAWTAAQLRDLRALLEARDVS